MGQKTVSYKSKFNKSLKTHFIEDYVVFRDWLLSENKKSIQEYEERIINEELEVFLIQNDKIDLVNNVTQKRIDELIFEYFLTYCDYGAGKNIFEMVGPCMNSRRYLDSHNKIEKYGNEELKVLWNILQKGKSIIDGNPFISSDEQNWIIGFWSKKDQNCLRIKLNDFVKSISEKPEGIEYILSVLDEVKNENVQLVLSIE